MTSDELLDLLTSAALIGRNEVNDLTTYGQIRKQVAWRMRKEIAIATGDKP